VTHVRDPHATTRGLVASDPAVAAGPSPPATGFRAVDTYVCVPHARRPLLLLPDGAGQAAGRALERFAQGSGGPARVAAGLASAGIRAGGLRALRGSRVALSVAAGTPPERIPDLVLRAHLERVLHRERVFLAVRVGAVRPNGKPVAQVLDAGGEALGFCKIGWNDLTRPLVAREGDALAELAAGGTRSFSAPRPIWRGDWQGNELLLVEPIAQTGHPTGPAPPFEATREVADLGGRTRSPLAESEWWAGIQARLAAVDHPQLAADAGRVASRFGAVGLAFGGCHGDWTPWNMTRADGRLVVWDWERFAHGAPVGQDAVHYAFMVWLRQRKRPPAEAERHVLETAPPVLEAIGADPAQAELLLMLHQLEIGVRFAEARAAEVTVRHDLFADGLHRMLA
jgi:hypothetical protein